MKKIMKFNCPLFGDQTIIYIAQKVKDTRSNLKKIKIIVHHTLVYTYLKQSATNSPEGVHQDGMDFIVSAFVIERVNIQGGVSIIYGADKKTPIFKAELQSGQGIFQADVFTELWHEVTPISSVEEGKESYRSTIGFDIEVL